MQAGAGSELAPPVCGVHADGAQGKHVGDDPCLGSGEARGAGAAVALGDAEHQRIPAM
jgi:hypothetical protein